MENRKEKRKQKTQRQTEVYSKTTGSGQVHEKAQLDSTWSKETRAKASDVDKWEAGVPDVQASVERAGAADFGADCRGQSRTVRRGRVGPKRRHRGPEHAGTTQQSGKTGDAKADGPTRPKMPRSTRRDRPAGPTRCVCSRVLFTPGPTRAGRTQLAGEERTARFRGSACKHPRCSSEASLCPVLAGFLLTAKCTAGSEPERRSVFPRLPWPFFQMTSSVWKVTEFWAIWVSCWYVSHCHSFFGNSDLEEGQQTAGWVQPAACSYQ